MPSASAISVGRNADGRLEVFFIGADGFIRHDWENPSLVGWHGVEILQGLAKALVVGENADGRLELVYIGLDDKLWHNWQTAPNNGWAGEVQFPYEVKAKDLAVERNQDGRLEIFFIDVDGNLWHDWENFDHIGWHGAERFQGMAKAIAMGRNADERLEVLYIGTDDVLYHNWQTEPNGGWHGEQRLGGQAKAFTVGRNADGRLEIFYIGLDDAVYHNWQTAPNNGWAGAEGFAGAAKALAVGRNEDGRLEVFFTDPENRIWHCWENPTLIGWHGAELFEGKATALAVGANADGRLELFYFGTDGRLYHNWQTSPNGSWAGERLQDQDEHLLMSGRQIFDPDLGNHVNDHCFVGGRDGVWHMYGIEGADPESLRDIGVHLLHATAVSLTQPMWQRQEHALVRDPNESVLWAPHVVESGGVYYMFYCGGHPDPSNETGQDRLHYRINLATSTDLWSWTRHPGNPLFEDGFLARDPMVMWNPAVACWVMYYCATVRLDGGRHIVAYRLSYDLLSWSDRFVAYTDPEEFPAQLAATESPFVVKRGDYYYLFIGPRPYTPGDSTPDWRRPGYDGTDIFRSRHWNRWTPLDYVGHVQAHAAEVVRDVTGEWYISHAGIKRGGLYLLPLTWRDRLDGEGSSL